MNSYFGSILKLCSFVRSNLRQIAGYFKHTSTSGMLQNGVVGIYVVLVFDTRKPIHKDNIPERLIKFWDAVLLDYSFEL